jgi:hypothetical protein
MGLRRIFSALVRSPQPGSGLLTILVDSYIDLRESIFDDGGCLAYSTSGKRHQTSTRTLGVRHTNDGVPLSGTKTASLDDDRNDKYLSRGVLAKRRRNVSICCLREIYRQPYDPLASKHPATSDRYSIAFSCQKLRKLEDVITLLHNSLRIQ